jgi:hypothetical protein
VHTLLFYCSLKICFKEKDLYYFHKKLKIKKKNQKKKNIFSGFLGGFFWVFWVGFYCQPCLEALEQLPVRPPALRQRLHQSQRLLHDLRHVVDRHASQLVVRLQNKNKTVSAVATNVADPGSGAFLTPVSGMGKKSGSGMNNPDHISESLETIFWVKILKLFGADPGWKKFGSGISIPDPQHLLLQ